MTRKALWALVFPCAALLTFGCTHADDSMDVACSSYCEIVGEIADDADCDFDDDAEQACLEDCTAALEDLPEDEQQEAVDCIQCLDDEIGDSPDESDWHEVYDDDCEDECEEDGMSVFMEEMAEEVEFFSDCHPPVNIYCDPQAFEACDTAYGLCAEPCDDDWCYALCCHDSCDCFEDVHCQMGWECHDFCEELWGL